MHRYREAHTGARAFLVAAWMLAATELPAATTQGASPPLVACSAEHVTVAFGETVALRVWAETPSNQPPRFAWQVPVGNVKGFCQKREKSPSTACTVTCSSAPLRPMRTENGM